MLLCAFEEFDGVNYALILIYNYVPKIWDEYT